MQAFPVSTAVYRGSKDLFRQPLVLVGIWLIAELLPLAVVPWVVTFVFFQRGREPFSPWLHGWALSQMAIVGFLCVALSGRWHWRVPCALTVAFWVWAAYLMGLNGSMISLGMVDQIAEPLAGALLWMLAISAFITSLVVSVTEFRLQAAPSEPRFLPRPGQFSLRLLIVGMFLVCMSLAAVRAVFALPSAWPNSARLLNRELWELARYGVWALALACAMTIALRSPFRWLWLGGLVVLFALVEVLMFCWEPLVERGVWAVRRVAFESWVWGPAVIAVLHSIVVALLLPRLGIRTCTQRNVTL